MGVSTENNAEPPFELLAIRSVDDTSCELTFRDARYLTPVVSVATVEGLDGEIAVTGYSGSHDLFWWCSAGQARAITAAVMAFIRANRGLDT